MHPFQFLKFKNCNPHTIEEAEKVVDDIAQTYGFHKKNKIASEPQKYSSEFEYLPFRLKYENNGLAIIVDIAKSISRRCPFAYFCEAQKNEVLIPLVNYTSSSWREVPHNFALDIQRIVEIEVKK